MVMTPFCVSGLVVCLVWWCVWFGGVSGLVVCLVWWCVWFGVHLVGDAAPQDCYSGTAWGAVVNIVRLLPAQPVRRRTIP